MKANILCLALLGLPLLCLAQLEPVREFYNEYKGLEDANTILLSGSLLKFAAQKAESEDNQQLIRKLNGIRLLTIPGAERVPDRAEQQLLKDCKKLGLEPLMEFRDKGQNVRIWIREEGAWITDVLVTVRGPERFVLFNLTGALNYRALEDMDIELEGGEQLKKLPEKRGRIPKA